MSMKIEIDAIDAEVLSILKKHDARGCLSWDVTIASGVTMKMQLTMPLGAEAPAMAIDAINACMGACIAAFQSVVSAAAEPKP